MRVRDRARVYHLLRTAHLERVRQQARTTVIYCGRSYDYDERLEADLDVRHLGRLRAAAHFAANRYRVVEVNEPLYSTSLPLTAAVIAAVRLRDLFDGHSTLIVSYAIANLDPEAGTLAEAGSRFQLRRTVVTALRRWVWRRLDRVAFGTSGAKETYEEALHARPSTALFEALPSPRVMSENALTKWRGPHVLFVGAFEARKGVRQLLSAWPLALSLVPDGRLTIAGRGPLAADISTQVGTCDRVTLLSEPSRSEILALYTEASVVVLPSLREGPWREQLGLPLVEALAAGCAVVTTAETGLASWLSGHGHQVLPTPWDERDLGTAVARALTQRRIPASVLADLPSTDGRAAADTWLFRNESS